MNVGNVSSSPQLSETQRAARDAVKMALDPYPIAKSSITNSGKLFFPSHTALYFY